MKHFLDGEAFIPNFVSLESQDKRENLKALHLANIKFPFSKYKLINTDSTNCNTTLQPFSLIYFNCLHS